MSDKKVRSILISGPRGIGKTTLVLNLINLMKKHNLKYSGFYTQEVRYENGKRIGFDVVSLDGKRAILARMLPDKNIDRPKIGKFSVFLHNFEELALPLLNVEDKTILIMDEIGKMELLSEKFQNQLDKLFGTTAILATIQNKDKTIDFIERIKKVNNTMLLEITRKNRNEMVDKVFERLCEMVLE